MAKYNNAYNGPPTSMRSSRRPPLRGKVLPHLLIPLRQAIVRGNEVNVWTGQKKLITEMEIKLEFPSLSKVMHTGNQGLTSDNLRFTIRK